jgi:hypothetical protein
MFLDLHEDILLEIYAHISLEDFLALKQVRYTNLSRYADRLH